MSRWQRTRIARESLQSAWWYLYRRVRDYEGDERVALLKAMKIIVHAEASL